MKAMQGDHLVTEEDEDVVRAYAFEGASVLPAGEMPLLDTVLRRWAKQLENHFFECYKMEAYVGCSVVNRVHFTEFNTSLQNLGLHYFFSLSPFEEEGLFVLDSALCHWCLERQGIQEGLNQANQRYLKPLAQKVLDFFFEGAKGLLPVEACQLRGVTNSFTRGRFLTDFEMCLVAWAHVSFGGVQGKIGWCLPYVMFHTIADQLEEAQIVPTDVMARRADNKLPWSALKKAAQVTMTVALGDVSGKQLARTLQTGDVLPLSTLQGKALVTVGGVPLVKGEIGDLQGNYAIRVDENASKEAVELTKNANGQANSAFGALEMRRVCLIDETRASNHKKVK